MSHISLLKVAIQNPNLSLLREAVKALASEMGAELVDEVEDYYGNRVKVPVGIRSKVFSRGVGVVVEDGAVRLKGDFYLVPQNEVERLQKLLVRNYVTLATVSSLRSLGYQVQARKVMGHVYIKAVNYA